jgi:hypothetical protein
MTEVVWWSLFSAAVALVVGLVVGVKVTEHAWRTSGSRLPLGDEDEPDVGVEIEYVRRLQAAEMAIRWMHRYHAASGEALKWIEAAGIKLAEKD